MRSFSKNYIFFVKLLEQGILTRNAFEEAFESLSTKNTENAFDNIENVIDFLIEKNYCNETDLATFLALDSGSKFMSISDASVSKELKEFLPIEFVQKYKSIPLKVSGKKVVIALKNPYNLATVRDLEVKIGREVTIAVLTHSEFEHLFSVFCNQVIDTQEIKNLIATGEDEEVLLQEIEEDSSPIVQLASQIISYGVKQGASDIHIEPQEKNTRVRFRIHGVLHEHLQIPANIHGQLIARIKVLGGMDIAQTRLPQDGRITTNVEKSIVDLRLASIPSTFGEMLTLRIIERKKETPTLKTLGMSDYSLSRLNSFINTPHGLILVTGPTGSGKSTSLYSILSSINTHEKKTITIEDPVEQKIAGTNQIQVNSRIGMNFSSILRMILRSDPDIIMIGEVRDAETAKIAMESSLTGHLVLSSLHTNDAPSAVTRLLDMGIEPFIISSSLTGVLAQRLVRTLCNKCKIELKVDIKELLSLMPDFTPQNAGRRKADMFKIYRHKGCIHCNNTGFTGRSGIYEILNISDEIQRLILTRASSKEIKGVAISEGMRTLREEGFNLVLQGKTSIEEVLRVID